MTSHHKNRFDTVLTKKLGCAFYLVIVTFIVYSVYYYLTAIEKFDEYTVCYEDNCIKTFHIHTTIMIEVCGTLVRLPLETGLLDGLHTHKERNVIHFHERLPYNSTTQQVLNNTPLMINTALNEMDIRFSQQCIKDYCNGRHCSDGKPGTVHFLVNDVPNAEFEKYVWKNGDRVKITFN